MKTANTTYMCVVGRETTKGGICTAPALKWFTLYHPISKRGPFKVKERIGKGHNAEAFRFKDGFYYGDSYIQLSEINMQQKRFREQLFVNNNSPQALFI